MCATDNCTVIRLPYPPCGNSLGNWKYDGQQSPQQYLQLWNKKTNFGPKYFFHVFVYLNELGVTTSTNMTKMAAASQNLKGSHCLDSRPFTFYPHLSR